MSTNNNCAINTYGTLGIWQSDDFSLWGHDLDITSAEQEELASQVVKDKNIQQSIATSDLPHRPSK